uniref:Uncharacterized protein n=1 Tax=Wuchereria bancrofti TaxID=6293 RepID=A0AAF5PIP8_WUCBA
MEKWQLKLQMLSFYYKMYQLVSSSFASFVRVIRFLNKCKICRAGRYNRNSIEIGTGKLVQREERRRKEEAQNKLYIK